MKWVSSSRDMASTVLRSSPAQYVFSVGNNINNE
jgi:hypothetical protein